MGYSLSAAIGAKFASGKDRNVVAVMGEGGFQMLMGELALVKEHNLNIKIFVISNSRLGMVRELQLHAYTKDSYHGIEIGFNPDFLKLADAYGLKGYRISHNDDIDSVLNEVFSKDEPCFVECKVHPDFPTLAHWRWK